MHTTHNIRCNSIAGCCLGNAKIHDFYLAVTGNHNILWFDIPVNNMIVVCGFNAHRYLNGNTDCFFNGKTGFFLDIFFKCNTLNQLHNNIIDTIFFTNIINTDNIGMHQSCRSLSFHTEFGNKICIFRKLLFQNFHCNKSVQFMVLCFIYIAHTAGTDFIQNLIAVSD